VDTVRASDHRRVFEFQGALLQDLAKAPVICQQQLRSLAHLQRLGGVHDVVRGEAVVQVAALSPNVLGHVGGEGNHVVFHLALDLEDALDFEARLAPDGPRRALRDQAGFRFNLRGSDFHFQPFLEFVLISPDTTHLRASVSRNHFASPNLD